MSFGNVYIATELVYLAGGLVLGALLGWVLRSLRPSAPVVDQRLEQELRDQLERRDAEVAALRKELTTAHTERAAAEASRNAALQLVENQRSHYGEALAETKTAQEKALHEVRETFKAFAADALKQTHPAFIELAGQTFAKLQESASGDLARRQQAIDEIVKPLREQLEGYQRRLGESETAQSRALGEVKSQLEMLAAQSSALANETQQFRAVLKSNQARGRWGEETLRRVVETAGMSAHCDFSEQTASDAGDAKPDLIVRLPGDRVIIVDAKVPDLDFLGALDAAEPVARAQALAEHAASLKRTIRALAERDYPAQFPNALDHVVLFLPAESLFSAALEGDKDLIVWAAARRIMLATPASLIALLRSVSLTWQQHSQAENARAIAETAQELFRRVAKFTEHFENIRAGLERANRAFNEAVGSYERMVRPQGDKVARLGAGVDGKDLPEIGPIDTTLRLPS
jgi:DNA recombination protein RmuC